MILSAAKLPGVKCLSRLLLIAVAINVCQARELRATIPKSPDIKLRPLAQLADALVAGRDKAINDPETPTVVLGYSSDATIQIPKGVETANPYFAQAAKQIAAKQGGVIRVEPGTYLLNDTFSILSSNTHFIGAGITKTILKLVDNAGIWQDCGMLFARGVEYISITDMTFDGNKANQDPDNTTHYGKYGNYLDQYKDVLFQRVKVANFLRYGFDPHGYNKQIWSDGLVVLDCISNNNQWDGFTFDQTFNVYIRNNTAIGNGRHGFNVITGSRNVLLENNVAKNNGFGEPSISHSGNGCAFMVDNLVYPLGTQNVTVQDNVANEANRGAFCTQDADNVSFIGNKAADAVACLDVRYNSTDITFSSNTCSKMKQHINFLQSDAEEVTSVGNIFD